MVKSKPSNWCHQRSSILSEGRWIFRFGLKITKANNFNTRMYRSKGFQCIHHNACVIKKWTCWCEHAHQSVFLYTVKSQRVIWSPVSLSCGSSLSLWCHCAAELVSKLLLMNRKSACYLQNVWEYQSSVYLSVHETRHTPLPDSTALNEHFSAEPWPSDCCSMSIHLSVWVGEWLSSKMQGCDHCLRFPMESFVLDCHPYISPTITDPRSQHLH